MGSVPSPGRSLRDGGPTRRDEHALRGAIDACLRDYPGATRERVEQLLWSLYRRTDGAKVQQYRVVLAERDARVQLRLDERGRRRDGTAPVDAPARRAPRPPADARGVERRADDPARPLGEVRATIRHG